MSKFLFAPPDFSDVSLPSWRAGDHMQSWWNLQPEQHLRFHWPAFSYPKVGTNELDILSKECNISKNQNAFINFFI